MRLPPVDTYREPLLVPLGTLVLHAAWLDNELITFISSLLPFGLNSRSTDVAHEMRNWNPTFMKQAIAGATEDADLVADFCDYVDRLGELRERRHRMVHDAMEVGIDGTSEGDARAILLREGFVRRGKSTHLTLARITPDEVAALACEFYDFRLEIDTFAGRLVRWNDVMGPHN